MAEHRGTEGHFYFTAIIGQKAITVAYNSVLPIWYNLATFASRVFADTVVGRFERLWQNRNQPTISSYRTWWYHVMSSFAYHSKKLAESPRKPHASPWPDVDSGHLAVGPGVLAALWSSGGEFFTSWSDDFRAPCQRMISADVCRVTTSTCKCMHIIPHW